MIKKKYRRPKYCMRCGQRGRIEPICQVVRTRWAATDWVCMSCADKAGYGLVDLSRPDGLAETKKKYPKARLLR